MLDPRAGVALDSRPCTKKDFSKGDGEDVPSSGKEDEFQ